MSKNIIITEEQLAKIVNRIVPVNESELEEGKD